jgi:hypothetical protein
MEIHKPKPWHGWREFLKELGTIVLGVLLALGAEQVVESLHWRHKLERAEENMRAEQRDDDLPQAYVRGAVAFCYRDQLRRLRVFLDGPHPDRLQFQALVYAYRPPIRTWDAQAWNATADSDVASHMEASRRLQWAGVYNVIPRLQNVNWQEAAILSRIWGVRRRAGPLSETEAADLAKEIATLQALNATMAADAMFVLASARNVGVEIPPTARAQIDRTLRARLGNCVFRPDPHVATMDFDALDTMQPDGEIEIQ